MFIILFITLCLLFGSLLEVLGLKLHNRQKIFLIITFIIFVLSFLRWERGADWSSYYNSFESVIPWDLTDYYGTNFEIGYWTLCVLVKSIFNNYTVLLCIYALILFSFRTFAILSYTQYPITALFVSWAMGFAGMYFVRSGIAVAILLYSIKYIQQKRFWAFLCLLLLAMSFHRSVIFFIFAYPLYYLNIKPFFILFSILVAILVGFMLSRSLLTFVAGGLSGIFEYKLNSYLGEDQGSTYGVELSYTAMLLNGIIKRVSFVVLGLYLLRKSKDSLIRGYVNFLWFGTLIYFLTVGVSLSLPRVAYPYDEIQILLLPAVFSLVKDKHNRLLWWMILSIFLLYRFSNNLFGTYFDLYVPYHSIFF